MATITATTRAGSTTTQLDVTITSSTAIADPVAYVQQASVSAEILARAGLDSTLEYITAVVTSSSSAGSLYTYVLIVTYGDDPASITTASTSHTHDTTTVDQSLTDAYKDGTNISLDTTYGPVGISAVDDASVDYFQIRTDTDTTARNLFYLKQGSILRLGVHTEFYADNTYDIGTPDAGATLYRPRDVRLGRNLLAGGNATISGYGSYGSYVLGTHHRFTAQGSNPDATAATRHIYVSSIDDSLRYWDGSSEIIMASGAGTSGDTVGQYTCPAGVAVGDVVVVSGADYAVKANATTITGKTVAGIVVDKPDATTANVKYSGETGSIFGGVLSTGSTYYLGRTDGAITNDPTVFVSGSGDTQIELGFAKNTNTLVIRIGEPSVL